MGIATSLFQMGIKVRMAGTSKRVEYDNNGKSVNGDVRAKATNVLVWTCRRKFELVIEDHTPLPASYPSAVDSEVDLSPPTPFTTSGPYIATQNAASGQWELSLIVKTGAAQGEYKYALQVKKANGDVLVQDDPRILID